MNLPSQSWLPDADVLFRVAPDGIVVTCSRGSIVEFNPAAEKQFGIAREAAIGRDIGSIILLPLTGVGVSAVQYLLQLHDLYLKTRGSRLQIAGIRSDSQAFPMELCVSPVKNAESLTGYVFHLRDVSKAKKTEESYQRLVDVMNATSDFVALWDDQERMIYCNPAGAHYIGSAVNKPTHKPMSLYRPLWAVERVLNEAIPAAQRDGMWRGETALLLNGVEVPVSQVLVAHKNSEGRITNYSTILRDISERKQAERDLIEAKESATKASQAKSRFVANMSHEIRTPMTAIVGYAELLVRSNITPEDRELWGRGIRQNSEYLLSLVNDILDIAKIEAGQVVLHPAPTDPMSLLFDIELLLRPMAVEKMIDFQMVFHGDLPSRIITDPVRLKQVLVNLIVNAIKFTEQGGVAVGISALVAPATGRCSLQFTVQDTGIGISKENLDRLFKAFGQVHDRDHGRFGGTGLGLAISRQLSLLLGGDVSVESELGVGSRFTLSLDVGPVANLELVAPVRPVNVAGSAYERAKQVPDFDGVRILVVDDNPDNQRIIRFLLEDSRADVTTADNGRIAVDAVTAAADAGSPYALVFMDMQMPVMDGYEAARALRDMGVVTPIIALTAFTMTDDKEKCISAGCNAYLTKPIIPAELFGAAIRFLHPDPDAERSAVPPGAPTAPLPSSAIPAPSSSVASPVVPADPARPAAPPTPVSQWGGAAPSSASPAVIPSSDVPARLVSTMANNLRFAPLLKEYIAGMPETIRAIQIDRQNWHPDSLKVRAHRIKGTAASYGYPQIGEASGQCETAIRNGQPREVVEPLVDRLIALLRAAAASA